MNCIVFLCFPIFLFFFAIFPYFPYFSYFSHIYPKKKLGKNTDQKKWWKNTEKIEIIQKNSKEIENIGKNTEKYGENREKSTTKIGTKQGQ